MFFRDLRDRRVDSWALMSSPLPTAAACCLYFYCVKFAGPQFMAKRKPFDLRRTIIVYNFLQAVMPKLRQRGSRHTYYILG